MRIRSLLFVAAWLLASGGAGCNCSDNNGGRPFVHPDGAPIGSDGGGQLSGGDGAMLTPDCTVGAARWIYAVDSDHTFLRFEPDTGTLVPLGMLSCPADMASPFSMAIDRDARAWVLHDDGNIYHVDIENGLSCSISNFTANQMGFEVFGMGFVRDPMATSETLYIGGGALDDVGTGLGQLGSIDVATGQVTALGQLGGWPELTGNGAGELWGFFPDSNPPAVRRIDRNNGATLAEFDVSPVRPDPKATGNTAWAFAFWGGRYYIFFKSASDHSTQIWRLSPDSGELINYVPNTGLRIVGAGVSTCAPVELI